MQPIIPKYLGHQMRALDNHQRFVWHRVELLYRENKQRELEVELARLEVVHVQDDIAVARVSKLMPIDEGLSIGMRSVLIGDYVGTGN